MKNTNKITTKYIILLYIVIGIIAGLAFYILHLFVDIQDKIDLCRTMGYEGIRFVHKFSLQTVCAN